MFNFLFDGTIGEILAPVVPTNKLYLAIQHHRNDEVRMLWDSILSNPNILADGSYAAIHIACRYNNRFAVELALSKGASIQLPDSQGSTPLHHAAKNGHLDLCRLLIENGSSAHLTNKQNQTAYDVAENHLVRQYLLPLVLQSEKAAGIVPPLIPGIGYGMMDYSSNSSYTPPPQQKQAYLQQTLPTGPPSVPMPMQGSGSSYAPYAPPALPHDAPVTPMTQTGVHPPISMHSSMTNGNNNGLSGIQPDGFHSSMSDPLLQQKYGHVIERVNIAPPPMAGAPSTYSAQQAIIGGQLHNRYVAYNPFNSDSQQHIQQQGYYHHQQQPAVAPLQQQMMYTPQQQQQYQQYQQQHIAQGPPLPLPSSSMSAAGAAMPPPPQAYSTVAATTSSSSSSAGSQRLLGNRAVFTPPQDEFGVAAVPMITHRPVSSGNLKSNSMMTSTDEDDGLSEVIIDASSSSIL